MFEIENTVATPLEDFDLVVEAFDKATALMLNKIVGDFLPPSIELFQEIIETLQAAVLNFLYPTSNFSLSLFLGPVHVEDGCQLFAQDISLLG